VRSSALVGCAVKVQDTEFGSGSEFEGKPNEAKVVSACRGILETGNDRERTERPIKGSGARALVV
jgi:hypothetical protein